MKIAEIYKKFGVSPNLQEHMSRVCAVVSIIEKHWIGESHIDWELAKKMALIHDVGNIVKFDLNNHPEFLGKEQSNIEHWKKMQRQMIEKYGTDDNEATRKMLTEIGIDPKVVEKVFHKRFLNSIKTEESGDWSLKILYYADLRALPLGIGTLEGRFEDVRKRYNPVYTERPDFEDLVEACRKIEKEIQENLDISVNEIDDEMVSQEDSSNLLTQDL